MNPLAEQATRGIIVKRNAPIKIAAAGKEKCLNDGVVTDIDSRLFNHLVSEREQVMRNSEAECIGGLEVEN